MMVVRIWLWHKPEAVAGGTEVADEPFLVDFEGAMIFIEMANSTFKVAKMEQEG